MTRPQNVPDVLDALNRHRLVEPARLDAFIARHQLVDVSTTLERLISEGILTAFQAGEIAYGRSSLLWLGGYRILDRLGKGAMGAVFLAEHSVLGRRVAVKVLSEALRADTGARKRFVREARAAATLDHPNIVRVFDVNMNNDPPYLVMEYVDGLSLQAAVSQYGTFSVGEAASMGVQVADGLVQAAAVGLVHRDIKPANLLVDRRGAAKILDLGIVRFTHEETFSRFHGGTDVILGTLDYLAPEQAEDSSKVDARADIYGLGSTLYFLLAGHPPYTIADPREKLAAKQMVDPPSIHQLRPDVSPEFSAVVARLMARCPAERYPSPAMAVAALHPWSAPGLDFPGRLFRVSSDSTDHGRRFTDHGAARDPIPDTVVIVKTGRRPYADSPSEMNAPTYPPDPPSEISPAITGELSEQSADDFPDFADVSPTDVGLDLSQGADTQGVGSGAALTDEVVLPPELMRPLDLAVLVSERNTVSAPNAAAVPVSPGNSPVAESPQNAGYRRGVTVGVLLAVVAVGVVAALIAIFTQ